MFNTIKNCLVLLRADKSGVTAVEYAVIAGVMVVAVSAAFGTMSTALKTYISGITF